MDLGIKGRRAIVTGGSSGIGYETARLFLEEGVRVLITGRDADKLDKAREELAKKTGGEMHAVAADMTKEADIERMVDAAKDKLGGVDILVNNAGTMYSGRFAVLDDDEMKKQLDTKLFGFMRAIRLVYPMMRAQKWGRIVNTIGGAGKEPDPYMFGSGMTKARCSTSRNRCRPSSARTTCWSTPSAPAGSTPICGSATPRGCGRSWACSRAEEARRLAAAKNSLNRFGKPRGARQRDRCSCARSAPATSPACRSISTVAGLKGLW